MDPTSEKDLKNLKKKLEKDYERTTRKTKGEAIGFFSGWQYIILILLVALLMIVFFFRKENKVPVNGLDPLIQRIENMEGRLTALNQKVHQLQRSVSDLGPSKGHPLQNPKGQVRNKDPFTNSQPTLEGRIPDLSEKKEVPLSEPEKRLPSTEKRFYEVRRGDTIYWIAKKHELSVEELLLLNGMEKNDNIFPGQKLVIE